MPVATAASLSKDEWNQIEDELKVWYKFSFSFKKINKSCLLCSHMAVSLNTLLRDGKKKPKRLKQP